VAATRVAHPREGDEVVCLCTGLDGHGAGVGELAVGGERLVVHVTGLLPGEEARVRLDHVSVHPRGGRREAWASLCDLPVASADRVSPWCPAFGICGGCSQMHTGYPAQLAWKRAKVQSELAGRDELVRVSVEPCLPSPQTQGYRNQAKYVYGRARNTGDLVLGSFAPRSHAIVDMAGCSMVEPVIEEVRRALLTVLIDHHVPPFEEVQRTGVLRYAILRATAQSEVLVTLVVARSDWQDGEVVAAALRAAHLGVSGVVLNLNAGAGNVLFGDEERLLAGRPTVEDVIGDARVRLSSRSFFQVNRHVAGRIYRDIAALAPARCQRIVDVYSGAGGIAVSLAPRAAEVVAIEENAAATETARAHLAEHGGAGNVRFLTGDAAHRLTDIAAADVVVLNPPRSGCAAEALAAVAEIAPGDLFYLSCSPSTLARDLAALVRSGAEIARVIPYDMMPHTPHVETLAHLIWRGQPGPAA
jgi:23S rRNA (uracil1939-C5)-methyltransferase